MESPKPSAKSVANMITVLKHKGAWNRTAIKGLIEICESSLATTHKWNYIKRSQLNRKINVLNFLLVQKTQPVPESDPVK
ncbi:MAG: hypothetical protein AAFO99_16245 [Bacteroidota bacterium]